MIQPLLIRIITPHLQHLLQPYPRLLARLSFQPGMIRQSPSVKEESGRTLHFDDAKVVVLRGGSGEFMRCEGVRDDNCEGRREGEGIRVEGRVEGEVEEGVGKTKR